MTADAPKSHEMDGNGAFLSSSANFGRFLDCRRSAQVARLRGGLACCMPRDADLRRLASQEHLAADDLLLVFKDPYGHKGTYRRVIGWSTTSTSPSLAGVRNALEAKLSQRGLGENDRQRYAGIIQDIELALRRRPTSSSLGPSPRKARLLLHFRLHCQSDSL